MTKPLADAWAKFNRAKIHSDGLSRKILAWMKAQGSRPIFRIEFGEDEASGLLILRVGRVKRLPPTWSLIAGDAIFNYRACLDYVAWRLVQLGTDPHPKEPRLVMWPIIRKQADADAMIARHLPGILPNHRAFVEACQPYQGDQGKLNPLVVLNDLSRHDKHRQLTLISAAHRDYKMVGRVRHFVVVRRETPNPPGPLPLKPGTELVRIFGRRTGTEEPEVNMRIEGTTGIAFENGLWVLDVLTRIEERIGTILLNLEPLLQTDRPPAKRGPHHGLSPRKP